MIKLIKSTFFNEDKTQEQLALFIKNAKMLSLSKECEKFEKAFAKFHKRKHCVLLNSGSSANLAMIQALLNMEMIKPGDLVGFSALTWSTNVMPLIQLGLQAVPIDVELDTLNVSKKKFLEVLERFPLKVFFITNLLGFCDDIDEIVKICHAKKIILIEDNCESLGSEYKGKLLGNFGLASSASFYVGHHMSTIEGGAVLTDNMQFATMLRLVRAHGWDRNLSLSKQNKMRIKFKVNSTFYSRYTFYDLGYNLRPTEITGFLGNNQMKYLPKIFELRNKNFKKIAAAIYQREDLYYPIRWDHMDFLSNFAVPIICRSVKIRDELVKKCENKIEIRPIVGGDMTQQPFFKKHQKVFFRILGDSNAKLIHERGLYFGNNPELTDDEIDAIVKVFTER